MKSDRRQIHDRESGGQVCQLRAGQEVVPVDHCVVHQEDALGLGLGVNFVFQFIQAAPAPVLLHVSCGHFHVVRVCLRNEFVDDHPVLDDLHWFSGAEPGDVLLVETGDLGEEEIADICARLLGQR